MAYSTSTTRRQDSPSPTGTGHALLGVRRPSRHGIGRNHAQAPTCRAKAKLVPNSKSGLRPGHAPNLRERRHGSAMARRIRQLEALPSSLDGYIGCGWLFMRKCTLFNLDDEAADEGSSASARTAPIRSRHLNLSQLPKRTHRTFEPEAGSVGRAKPARAICWTRFVSPMRGVDEVVPHLLSPSPPGSSTTLCDWTSP